MEGRGHQPDYGAHVLAGGGLKSSLPDLRRVPVASHRRSCQGCSPESSGRSTQAGVFHFPLTGAAARLFRCPQDLAVRTEGNPKALATAVRRAVWEVDPQQPLAQVKIMSEYLEEDMAPRRFQTQLLSGFATLALILAALGPVCSSFL